jgi:hypothetical protein
MNKIYIAGPYSRGDVAINVRNAISAADYLSRWGWTPFIPHLTHFWHMAFPHEYQFWLDQDMEWLKCCDALLRLRGESGGADKEVAWARDNGLPVYFSEFEVPHLIEQPRLSFSD